MNPRPTATHPPASGRLPEPIVQWMSVWGSDHRIHCIQSAVIPLAPTAPLPSKAQLRAVQRLLGMNREKMRERLLTVWRRERIEPDDVLDALGLLAAPRRAKRKAKP